MNTPSQPLVTVLTPVYNGAKFLAECIESVIAQTYSSWEHVIVNNCSTDRTREIAEGYARKDNRIRILDNDSFVDVIRNHNIAFRQISSASRYCKMLHADDFLFADCLKQMIAVAEANPSVGIVGAYSLYDPWVKCDGLPFSTTVLSGLELGRRTLLGETYPFLSPTSLLIRSDLVADTDAVYNVSHIYADVESAYELLQRADFGFVHQVLTYIRCHNGSMTASFARRLNTILLSQLYFALKYGPIYLSPAEHAAHLEKTVQSYYEFLAKSLLLRREKRFWQYHRNELKAMGCPLSYRRLLRKTFSVLLDVVLNPKRSIENIARKSYRHYQT